MALIKLGESMEIMQESIMDSSNLHIDASVIDRFEKFASNLKTIAPKAKDFLYFSAVMMHAAESALLDNDGNLKKDASGNYITSEWKKNGDSWKWVCSDPGVMPTKNANGDIFPEEELLKAHKKWVGRPLCLDHQSDSVDMIRGLIVDTYYDYPRKRVIALCALDKVNYPDLARKVSTGYASSVSMGTAVGKAICTDCGCVARIESEFCHHMKAKSCYGEINIDLNPIELSIVVNGADPKAKIRQVIASAQNINNYLNKKEAQIANLSDDSDKSMVSEIVSELEEVLKKVKTLEDENKELESEKETEKETEDETETEKETEGNGESEDKNDINDLYKSTISAKKVHNVINGIYEKLTKLQNQISKLSQNKEGNTMVKKDAYWQGGGGPNEPTPHQTKYPIDPLAQQAREQDKQMVGQMDTGPVDGMHPGPDSVGMSEEERKKLYQRASAENRAVRRNLAVEMAKKALQNKAYWNGGGGLNEPTPHETKYPVDPLAQKAREQDKQMVGKSPFPDVGKVDELYPGDKKIKEMLQRAKLTAKFIKAATPDGKEDKANSCWQIFADNKLILNATVGSYAGSKSEELYDLIATKQFGQKLLNTIRTQGFDKCAALFKEAQVPPVPAPAAPAPAAPGPAPTPPPMGEETPPMEELPPETDMPEEVPEKDVGELLDDLENLAADLRNAVEALTEEPPDKLDTFEELNVSPEEKMVSAKRKNIIHKKLGKVILTSMNSTQEKINSLLEELKISHALVKNKYELEPSKRKQLNAIVASVVEDGKELVTEANSLKQSFVKFAKATELLIKEAQTDLLSKPSEPSFYGLKEVVPKPTGEYQMKDAPDKLHETGFEDTFLQKMSPEVVDKQRRLDEAKSQKEQERLEFMKNFKTQMEETQPGDTVDISEKSGLSGISEDDPVYQETLQLLNKADDTNYDADEATVETSGGDKVTVKNPSSQDLAAMTASQHDLTTKEGRMAFREELSRLAQTGLKFNPLLEQAHPGGGTTVEKATGDLGKVHTLQEVNKRMVEVAQAPPKVRQAAKDINDKVVTGEINPNTDFPYLVSMGLDADAVKYWKEYYGQGDEGSKEFAAEFTKSYDDEKKKASLEQYEVKIARAYDLANQMARKGMINSSNSAIKEQVNELMKVNDQGYESLKRIVEKHESPIKTASIPVVGETHLSEGFVFPSNDTTDSLKAELEQALWPADSWMGK